VSEYEFALALRIRHPSIEPAQITEALGIGPQHAWKAGDARRGAANEVLEGSYRESYWTAPLTPQPQLAKDQVSVESVLLEILAKLRRSYHFLQDMQAQGGGAELQVSIFARTNFRIELLAESLALLGRLGIDVALEVQPHPLTETPQVS
jgi:Domain of unknown function (DUF4279)